MKRERMIATVLGALLGILSTAPLRATVAEGLASERNLMPESDGAHPTVWFAALPVTENMTIVECGVSYYHGRSRYHGGEREPVELPKGGKLKFEIEISSATGTSPVAQRSLKVKRDDLGARQSWGGLADPSGAEDAKPTAKLPVGVQAGDVILLSVRFKGMPGLLGVEDTGSTLRHDTVFVAAGCSTCGSRDSPCPE